MSRRSIAPLLRETPKLGLCEEAWGWPMFKLLEIDADPTGEGRALRAAESAPHLRSPLRIPFHRGEVQLLARGADLVLDITVRHFGTSGHPRREHAYGTLTRIETQHLVAALVAFLASNRGAEEAA